MFRLPRKRQNLRICSSKSAWLRFSRRYLKKVQNYKGDDLKKYIEKIAKDELGYVGDGERIFINVAGE